MSGSAMVSLECALVRVGDGFFESGMRALTRGDWLVPSECVVLKYWPVSGPFLGPFLFSLFFFFCGLVLSLARPAVVFTLVILLPPFPATRYYSWNWRRAIVAAMHEAIMRDIQVSCFAARHERCLPVFRGYVWRLSRGKAQGVEWRALQHRTTTAGVLVLQHSRRRFVLAVRSCVYLLQGSPAVSCGWVGGWCWSGVGVGDHILLKYSYHRVC